VVLLLQPQLQGRTLALTVDYDMFLPTRFVGDRGRVRQVLTNLVGNAVKFTERGEVAVRVTGGPGAAPGSHAVRVTVEDTGIGIAPDMLEHIFGEFTQIENDRNRRFEGTGLGLAVTRRLVRLMGGEVWVDSEPGRGSTFGFRIDMAAAGPATEPLAALAGCAVVVVDPLPAAAALLAGQVRSLGMVPAVFSEGAEALAALPEDAVAVIAEADLPDMTAATLAQALADDGLPLPVFALSRAGTDPGGPCAVLARPLDREALRRALATVTVAAAPPPAAPLRAMRVLAAEDNRTNQLVLSRMLRDLDIELRFAGNGREAVAAHAQWQPDLVFMDISMPEMDGKAATRAIREAEAESGRHTPVVALTAHALSGDDAAILAAGLDHYLTKPLRKPAIVERILAARPPSCRPVEPRPAEVRPPEPQILRSRATAAT
jgi:CheY-like chemotaxis protein